MTQHYTSTAVRPDDNNRSRELLHLMVDQLMDQFDLTGETLDVTDISLNSEWNKDYLVQCWILVGGGVPSE